MKLLRYFLLGIFLFISSISGASVLINVDEGVVILAINGKEVASGSKQDGFRVENGTNQILVEYSAEVEESNSDFYIEKTGAYVISFDSSDGFLQLGSPALNNSYDFRAFKENPKWLLTDKSGNNIGIKVAELVKEGFQLNRSYEEELADFNMSNSPAALSFGNNFSIHKSEVVNNMAEQMLKYWYVNSTPEVKAEFIKWIKNK